MNRVALVLLAALTFAWIVGSLFLLPGSTVSSILRTVAVLVDIPLAAWLGGLGWTAYRRARTRRGHL